MLAIVEAWRSGLLRRDNWIRNIAAGLVVGVVSIPLSMAFAIASGAKPEQGLYTAIVAALAVSLFGGTRVQIAGPTGAFTVLLFQVVAQYGMTGLQVATLLAGLILLVFGITKLGSVIRFIPEPVILGFTAGIGVVVWVGQWESFFGLEPVAAEHFHEKLLGLAAQLPHLDVTTTALALASIAVLVIWPRIPALGKVPAPLVALVLATVAQRVLILDGVATIGSAFGGIPSGLPSLRLPHVTLGLVIQLMQPAFAIALLGAIESLLSATVADGMTGTKHDSNQELVGQGLANIASAAFGGFAATGAIARTATNVRHGGNSPLAGIASSVTIVLVLVVLAPFAAYVPLATLAAVLWVVAYNMSDVARVARVVKRAPRADVAIMLVTLGLTVFTDLILAVNVGVVLAMLNFMRRMASSVEVRSLESEEIAHELRHTPHVVVPDDVFVYTIDGPFFFGAVQQFEAALAHTHTEPDRLVISLERVPFIDLTGILALRDVIETSHKHHVDVRLCCANDLVAGKLERAGIAELLPVPVDVDMARAVSDQAVDAA